MNIEKIYNTISIPALIVHEVLHLLFIKLTFSKFSSISVNFDEDYAKNGRMFVLVSFCSSYKIQEILVCMAPFIASTFWIIPLFFDLHVLSIIMLLYTILCIKTVIPSKEDFEVFQSKKPSLR